jgi:hypothetical protein
MRVLPSICTSPRKAHKRNSANSFERVEMIIFMCCANAKNNGLPSQAISIIQDPLMMNAP